MHTDPGQCVVPCARALINELICESGKTADPQAPGEGSTFFFTLPAA